MTALRLVPLALALLVAATRSPAAQAPARPEMRALAGERGDFLAATHVRLRGTQREIGRALAELAAERHRFEPSPARDPRATRAQREYFEAHAPLHLERMRGLAELLGLPLEEDSYELAGLAYASGTPGCTVVFYPPGSTETGQGILSRNFDFTTGTFEGRAPPPGTAAACAAPYVLELYPERGYATLCVVAFDLLGVVDGMNSEGLVIALLADDELGARARPSGGVEPGFDVLQIGRHVLETCADVAEAERALRAARLYYSSIPCHYLVADRHGRSFVWENDVDLSKPGHVLPGSSGPQITTNYLQHLHPDPASLPDDPDELGLFGRECTLRAILAEQEQLSVDEIRANAERVSARGSAPEGFAPGRTLWHSLYFPAERRLEVDFYLGEARGPGGEAVIRRSPALSFTLAKP